MSNLCVSLELAKKMKELGWKTECCFIQIEKSPDDDFYCHRVLPLKAPGIDWEGVVESSEKEDNGRNRIFEAYYMATAQEILDELPYKFERRGELYIKKHSKTKEGEYSAGYQNDSNGEFIAQTRTPSIAEALGQLRCWCKENGYLPKGTNTPSP